MMQMCLQLGNAATNVFCYMDCIGHSWFTVTLKACVMEMGELKQKRWNNGKGAVRAIKDVALAQGNCAIVIKEGGRFVYYSVTV
ncbi:hypothetical protein Plhal304r1_c041g0119201 [Plasmopara halstedii]